MTQYLDSLWVIMIEDAAKEKEEVVVEVVELVEVEFVMQIDGTDFRAIIVIVRVTLVATTGL